MCETEVICWSFNIFYAIFHLFVHIEANCMWQTFTSVFCAVTWASLVLTDFQFVWLDMSHKNATTAALTHMATWSFFWNITLNHFSATDLSYLLVEGHHCLYCFFDGHIAAHVQPTVAPQNSNFIT
jgi:hypothetical protein